MKKLIALIAVLGFATQASAQVELTHTGSFRLQYFNDDNADFTEIGTSHEWQQRFKWNIAAKAGENVTANLSLVHAAAWGSNADQIPGGTASAGMGHVDTNTLIVNEAYATWMMSDELVGKFGRGSFTMADGSVVSANEWEQVQKAFEGGMLSYDHEVARISAFGVRGANAAGVTNYGNFMGISADFKTLPEWLKAANLHYITVKRDEGTYDIAGTGVPLGKEDTTRLGVTVSGDTKGFDYRATYAMYDGETDPDINQVMDDVSASMMDVEVGYRLADVMNMRISALYHSDTGTSGGDNETYTGFHYDTHNNAGLMDVLSWGNLTYTKAGVSVDPADDVTVGAAYYMFEATEDADDTYFLDGTSAGATGDSEVGTELDVWVTKKYSNNFAISGWYSMFELGDRFSGAEDRTQIYFAGNYTF